MTTDNTESKRAQLEQRAQQLNEEYSDLQRQAEALRRRIVAIDGLTQAAQRRYDLQGEDSAADEIKAFTDERITANATIAELTRQAQAIPGRINAINQKLEAITHRERLRTLAQQRRIELEAYNLYEQTILDALEAYQALWEATSKADATFRTCNTYANANKTPTYPVRGALNYPKPTQHWFTGSQSAYSSVKGELERTRAKLPTVE